MVDLVFLDAQSEALILVELKRGRLVDDHAQQLRRYMDNAGRSRLLAPLLVPGRRLHGVLATVEDCELDALPSDMSVRIVDREGAIDVLCRLRRTEARSGRAHAASGAAPAL